MGATDEKSLVNVSHTDGNGNISYTITITKSAPKYKCGAEECSIWDASGPFTTADCDGKCGPLPAPKYSCDGAACREDAGGTYSTHDCDGKCTAPPPPPPVAHYKCESTGTCIRSDAGPYTTDDCDNKCVAPSPSPAPAPTPAPAPVVYSCIGVDGHARQCYGNNSRAWPDPPPDKDKTYGQPDCEGHCPEPPPSYSCEVDRCKLNATGEYLTDHCEG